MANVKELRGRIKSVSNIAQDHEGDGDGGVDEAAQGAGTGAQRAAPYTEEIVN